MAAAALLRSVASKMARAPPPTHHQVLLAHGGARSGPVGFGRGLHSSSADSWASGSTPPSSKMDLCTVLAKTRAGLAYVTLFGSIIYMNCSLFPRLDRLEEKLKAQKGMKLNDLTEDGSTNVPEAQIMQSSGHSKQPLGATGKGRKFDNLEEAHYHVRELEADNEALQAEITELKIALESAGSKGNRNL